MNNARPWWYSAFDVEVSRSVQLSPQFLRLTFTGASLRHFAPWGADQRIKLVLPFADGSIADFGLLDEPTPPPSHWYSRWKALPEDARNVMRTYTPSAIRPELGEVDIDFFLHEPAGPASAWAAAARPGDRMVLTGPDVRVGYTGYGIHWNPGEATRFLLVADETALPAVRNILPTLPAGSEVTLLLELGDPADGILTLSESVVRVHVPRQTGLEQAVRAWGSHHPATDGLYAWLAGESGVITRTRHHLTHECGVPKQQIASLGYWQVAA